MTSKTVTCFNCGTEYPIRPPKPYTPCEEHEKLLNDPGYAKTIISEIQLCPECGSGARLATPETEDMLRKRPMPEHWTPEERTASVNWWKTLDAKRKQLQGYFARQAARHSRQKVFKNLILRAMSTLGEQELLEAKRKKKLGETVFKKVLEIDSGNIIQEIEKDESGHPKRIYWRNPDTGAEDDIGFPRFLNIVSELRQPRIGMQKAPQ